MSSIDLRSTVGRFRFLAVLEALSWLGLLIGMAFKYLPDPGNEVGVKVFGPIHGCVFILFVLAALLTARELEWNWKVTLLALASSIPPFCTVVFEIWAARTGRLDGPAADNSAAAETAAGAESAPVSS